ncbi:hypothetical protein [Streptomyces buecherae]|uniref:Uncharacterized protein n=1 Tax=Streptomyces buecherae TaxID=2763006 RepID=A0A7H8N2G8_9ACTN|nr:hypothetical protein [Streptomyces buecherae]QKW48188.1 hypothetical protein HUT08_18985 [Streptomyces buecherae]
MNYLGASCRRCVRRTVIPEKQNGIRKVENAGLPAWLLILLGLALSLGLRQVLGYEYWLVLLTTVAASLALGGADQAIRRVARNHRRRGNTTRTPDADSRATNDGI